LSVVSYFECFTSDGNESEQTHGRNKFKLS
jgi:hypothetical protein